MNRNETLKILAVIRAAYPYYYNNQSEEDLKTVVSLWQGMFEEYEYGLVSGAVRAFIASDTKGFPPSVGMVGQAEAAHRAAGALGNGGLEPAFQGG